MKLLPFLCAFPNDEPFETMQIEWEIDDRIGNSKIAYSLWNQRIILEFPAGNITLLKGEMRTFYFQADCMYRPM